MRNDLAPDCIWTREVDREPRYARIVSLTEGRVTWRPCTEMGLPTSPETGEPEIRFIMRWIPQRHGPAQRRIDRMTRPKIAIDGVGNKP